MQSVQPKNGYGMTVAACLWLGLFPLLQGGTYASITRDKWTIMLALSAFTLVCFAADGILLRVRNRENMLSVPRCLPLTLAGALLLWTVLSCLCSLNGPGVWWLGESARREGLSTQLCYFLLFACFFFARVRLKPVLLSAAAGVTVFFVVVLLQRTGNNPLGLYPAGRSFATNYEFQGTIGNIDMCVGYLVLLCGLFLYGLVDFFSGRRSARDEASSSPDHPDHPGRPGLLRNILFPAVLLTGLALSVFLIMTMDVQFGIISAAVLLVCTFLRFLPKKLRLPVLILLLVCVLLVVWFWPDDAAHGGIWELHEIFRGRARLSFGSNRLAVWKYSLGLAGESLLLGGGSGTFAARFNQYLADHDLVIPREQDGKPLPDYFDNPHNEYISRLTDHGLPAMLLFMALILLSVFRRREGWFPLLSPCSAAVLGYAVQAFFSFSVCIVAPMFWVLLGLSFREE